MKTIVGLFDDLSEAHRAVDELTRLGVAKNDVSVITQNRDAAAGSAGADHDRTHAAEGAGIGATTGALAGGAAGILASLGLLAIPGIGGLLAAGPLVAALTGAGVGAAAGGIIGGLVGLGIPEEHAEEYEEGIKRGGTVVTAKVDDARAQEVAAIFDRHHAVDMDSRSAQWRASGWQPKHCRTDAAATTGTASAATHTTPTARTPATPPVAPARRGDETQRIPVVDEKLSVGKRTVERGGVRVYSRTVEQPVAEQVNLHKETVHVERRAADRPATAADLNAFKQGTIEVRETSEEPVVQKQARVTGEVVVRKDAEERTETIRDTVRKTDVQVEKLDSANTANRSATPNSNAGPSCNT
jgi:uncharacterized protein (TIGR02271 family)